MKTKYHAQENVGGKWNTMGRFDTAEEAWNYAIAFKKGRVIHKGKPVQRPEDLDADEEDGRSIVKRAYRARYQSHNDTNGDNIAKQMKEHLHDVDEGGSRCINRSRLEKFAHINDLWQDKYSSLNNGQVRMNVGNRLRARLRKNADWEPKWPKN